MLQLLLRCLACLTLVLYTLPAVAKAPAGKGSKSTAAKLAQIEEPTVDADAEAGGEAETGDDEEGTGTESAGIECVPAISEVETRRPIPFSCTVTKEGVDSVELRYKAPGRKKWTKIRLKDTGKDWTGEIPCMALTKRGALKLSIVGLDEDKKTLARIGGVEIRLVDATNEPPPSYPGREPPMRCYSASDCPPELRGSPACPGTKAAAGLRGWGAACEKTGQCQSGLACVSGTCDKPAKCDTAAECGSGECIDGTCSYPDPEELASRLGPPKHNWIGLHFGVDLMRLAYAPGVCGVTTADSKDYTCYNGKEAIDGTALNDQYSGTVPSGFALSTMRVMASYDRWFGRLGAGARLGFAFGGAPKDFNPVHIELRVKYGLRNDHLNKRFRPYIGLAAGMAEVQSHAKVTVINCATAADAAGCQAWKPTQDIGPLAGATQTKLDAYKDGKGIFFGPSAGFVFALANDQALQLNVNVMFPDLAIEPSVGYLIGL